MSLKQSSALGNQQTQNVPYPVNSGDAVNKAYADELVVGLLDDRGNFDASSNTFPATGGSGYGFPLILNQKQMKPFSGLLLISLIIAQFSALTGQTILGFLKRYAWKRMRLDNVIQKAITQSGKAYVA